MDERHVEEDKMVEELFEASHKGSVSFLTTLIQRDPLILSKVSLTSLRDTPLHIATLHGHLEFCKIILGKKPRFAEEVDALGRTPLHLASAEGHTKIVQALLQANTHVCFASDRDERIPLHLAAMRGRKEIVRELISAQPESIRVYFNEESVLHLCVRYNQLDALKCLVESADCNELLISKDRHGNSILDLAVMLKQKKAIKYLRSVPRKERVAINVPEIENTVDVRRSIDEAQPAQSTFRRWWGCVRSVDKRLKNPRNWIEKTRGSLMLVATVMATMSFQAVISPPDPVGPRDFMAYEFRQFLSYNTISFLASACVIHIVICGFPLTSKYVIWLLSLAMNISVGSMTYAYLSAVNMATSPNFPREFYKGSEIFHHIVAVVLVIVILTHIIRPLYWMVKTLRNFIRKSAAACVRKHDHTGKEVCKDDLGHL